MSDPEKVSPDEAAELDPTGAEVADGDSTSEPQNTTPDDDALTDGITEYKSE